MSSTTRIALALSLVVLVVIGADAQSSDTKQTPPAKKAAVAKPGANAGLESKELRSRARLLLVSLETDARTFREQTLRARSLARIADALWQVDAERARLLFRKAWEAAEVGDQESDRKLQDEINQQKTRSGGFAINLPPNLRREVLKLAARHDRVISEEFLERLITQKVERATATSNRPNTLFDRPDEALSQRLGVANELLKTGDTERAMQFAAPALTAVSAGSIDFLSDLREKESTPADAAYAALLASSANNPQSDANTVSFLASYIFTPHLYMTFSSSGASTSQMSPLITPAGVAPDLRGAFFQSAAAILLRPLPAPGQPDQSSSGVDGKYLVIKRLLPFFEQYATPEIAESLRGHLNALNAVVSENARQRDDEWISKGIKPDKSVAEREQALLDRIDRAKSSAERDSLYIQLSFMTSSNGEMRAREFVSKIENPETRKQAQAFIDSSLANYFVEKKRPDEALELVQKGELTSIHKSWVLTECAKIVAKTDRDKALELIDEATEEARRIEPSDSAHPRALMAVANALKEVDVVRVWDATFDAVKAANSAEGFTGEDGQLVLRFQSKGQASIRSKHVAEFDLDGIFTDLALQDYERAVEVARGFQAEGPRAVATIAIARAILTPRDRVNSENRK